MMRKNDSSGTTNKRFGVIRFTIYTFAVLLNGIVAICTLLGKAACFVNPLDHILPSYLGLAFPYLVIANLLFLLFWIIKRKYYVALPILTLLVCYPETRRTFSIGHDVHAEGDTLSVMSYNVQMFEFFAPRKKNHILQLIEEVQPDILCIQEFGHSNLSDHLGEKDIQQSLYRLYPHHKFMGNDLSWNAEIGEAILSKHPIVRHGVINLEENTGTKIKGVLYADILFKGDTIRIINCHLESNRITENEKKTLQKIKAVSKEDANQVVNSVSNKMSVSYKNRAKQANIIHQQLIKECPLPIILCGDFNDVPVSYAYQTIRGDKLLDAFEESATGYGYTYNKQLFHFRIDQIMHSKEAKAIQFHVGDKDYSDHYPISCKIVF